MSGQVNCCVIFNYDEAGNQTGTGTGNGPDSDFIRKCLDSLGYNIVIDMVNQDFNKIRSSLQIPIPGNGLACDMFVILIYAYGSPDVPNRISGSRMDPENSLDLVEDILKNVARIEALKGKWKKFCGDFYLERGSNIILSTVVFVAQ